MVRISPLSEKTTTLDSERINTWPLLYKNNKSLSILWPIADFDKDGFAIRPVFNKDKDDYSILFPLSGWNPKDGDGWVLNTIWNDEVFWIFPIAAVSDTLNYIGPIWWDYDVLDNYECGLFPLAGYFGDGKYHFTLFYKVDDDYGVFPLAHKEKNKAWIFPLYYNKRDKYLFLLGLLGKLHYKDNGDYDNYMLPLYLSSKIDDKSEFTTPLFHITNDKDELKELIIYPLLYGQSKDKNEKTYAQIPTFYYSKDDNSSTFLTPLFGQISSKTNDKNEIIIPPLLFNYYQDDKETNILQIPTFYYDNDESSSTLLTPLFGHRSNENDNGTGIMIPPLLFSYYQNDNNTKALQIPTFYYDKDEKSSILLTPLFSKWNNNKNQGFSNVLGPIFHYSFDEQENYITCPWPLFEKEVKNDKLAWHLFPIFSYSEIQKKENPLYYANLISYESTDKAKQLYSLLGLVHYEKNNDFTSSRFWPLFNYSQSHKTEDDVYDLKPTFLYSQEDKTKKKSQSVFGGLIFNHETFNTPLRKKEKYSFLTPVFFSMSDKSRYNKEKEKISEDHHFNILGPYGYYTHNDYKDNDTSINRMIFPFFSEDSSFGKRRIPESADNDYQNTLAVIKNSIFPFYTYKKELFNIWDTNLITAENTNYINAFIMCVDKKMRKEFCGDRYFYTSHKIAKYEHFSDKLNKKRKRIFNSQKEKYKDATIKILKEHNISCIDRKDETVMKALLELAKKSSKENKVCKFNIPIFFDYEYSENITKWEFLFGIMQSQAEKNIIKTSVLRYFYKKVQIDDKITRDIFPFIKSDTSADKTQLSFLWRVLNYEHNKEGIKGHILFIPWSF